MIGVRYKLRYLNKYSEVFLWFGVVFCLIDELLDFLCCEILVFIQIVKVMTSTYRRKMEAPTRHQSTNSGHKPGSRCLLTYEMNGEVDLQIDYLIVNPKVMPLV